MATINGVEVIGDKSAHDFDLLDKNDGVNLANGVERNRKATEDNHEDIVLHRTDRDVHVTPEWKNSLVTKEILGLYWTAAQTADIINEISIAGGAKLVKVDVLPETGLEQTIYLVPKTDPQQGDVFDEFVWVDGKYEFIGTTKANLSNYYTKIETDYLFSQLDYKYVRSDDTTLVKLTNLNEINLQEDHYNAWFGYRDGKVTNWKFGDGTEGGLANVWANDYYLGDEKLSDIVVKSTDYATSTKGGVIKFSTSHGIVMSADGFLMGSTRTAEQYASNSGNMLINKGTLENVFTYKGFATNSDVVHKTGNETVDGVKTFTSSMVVDGSGKLYQAYASDYVKGVAPSAVIYQGLRFYDDQKVSTVGNHITGAFEIQYGTDGYNKAYIGCRNYADTSQHNYNVGLRVPNDATRSIDFLPSADGKINLGAPAYKWADVQTEKINGDTVVTPIYLENYLETKAEEWEFTLSDGSMVTKKIVMA